MGELCIFISFCGGCNPHYDRVGIVKKIEQDFPTAVLRCSTIPVPDMVLRICGCDKACGGEAVPPFAREVYTITSNRDYPSLYERLLCTRRTGM